MKTHNKFLSVVLLVLIGVLLGIVLTFLRQGTLSLDFAEVRYTEITRSDLPVWTDEELEKIDDRFVFRTVAETVTPAVVYIETVVTTRNQRLERESDSDEEERFWRRFMPPRAQSVGSGVIISSDGYILTNNHVVADAVRSGINVTLADKREYEARIVGQDPSTDLAVLKIDQPNLLSLTIGNSDRVQVGDWVLAVGNPFRLRSTVTAGIVSALSRDVEIINDVMRIESFIQTDAAINRGNSGGALVNTSGELIGINTAIATQSGSYQGYGFAVPSNLAMKVAQDLIEHGEVRRGMLGVSIQSVDNRVAVQANLDRIRGVIVTGVNEDGAAGRSGIENSDIILEVNGEEVNESNQLQQKVAMFRPDDTITLTIFRDGDIFNRSVTLQEMPRPEPAELSFNEEEIHPDNENYREFRERESEMRFHSFDRYGFTIQGVPKLEDSDQYNFYVYSVQSGSIAHHRGLQEGAYILEMDGEEVNRIEEIEKIISDYSTNSRPLNLKIETESGSTGYFKLD